MSAIWYEEKISSHFLSNNNFFFFFWFNPKWRRRITGADWSLTSILLETNGGSSKEAADIASHMDKLDGNFFPVLSCRYDAITTGGGGHIGTKKVPLFCIMLEGCSVSS
jgi:hypothetical protein